MHPAPADDPIPTRSSLLEHLKDWQDRDGWQEFFDTYWRLIYGVARKAGLMDHEAEEVVQETVVSVAKQMPTFQYDQAGSFKGWLLQITRRRIVDQSRKRAPWAEAPRQYPMFDLYAVKGWPVQEVARTLHVSAARVSNTTVSATSALLGSIRQRCRQQPFALARSPQPLQRVTLARFRQRNHLLPHEPLVVRRQALEAVQVL